MPSDPEGDVREWVEDRADEIVEEAMRFAATHATGWGWTEVREYTDRIRAVLDTPQEHAEDDHVRFEDGNPDPSHRWEWVDMSNEPHWRKAGSCCQNCGVWIEDDEALEPCAPQEPPEPVAKDTAHDAHPYDEPSDEYIENARKWYEELSREEVEVVAAKNMFYRVAERKSANYWQRKWERSIRRHPPTDTGEED